MNTGEIKSPKVFWYRPRAGRQGIVERMKYACLGICAALLLPACGDDSAIFAGEQASLDAGKARVDVDTGAQAISFSRGDTRLLHFPAAAFELGTTPTLDDTINYDPYRLYVETPLYSPPPITWRAAQRFSIVLKSAEELRLRVFFSGGKKATLSLKTPRSGTVSASLIPDAAQEGEPIAFFRLRPKVDANEAFYGLGEVFDDLNHRGKVRGMQIEFMPELESGYNEAHVPVPFVIGTKGWGLFVESKFPGVFALGTEKSDQVDTAFGTGLFSEQGLLFHLFAEDHPLDIPRAYYDITGYPKLPARWALGPWVWRDENKDQAEVESDLDMIRSLDLATTGLWVDRPYASGVNTFDFNAPQFPNAQAMIDKAHALGFHMALWHTPYLDEKDPAVAALLGEAVAGGYFPKESGLSLNKWGTPIDFTNPAAYAFWQNKIKNYGAMGIEGYKMDYGEDIVPGLTSGRNTWVFSDGSDERTMHHGYTLLYHQIYAETLPAEGGFLLCRAGKYGDQKNGPIIWPGDLDADFSRHGESKTDANGDSYVAVGGFPASVIAGLSLGPSGFPFYGSDTGGYRHSPPNKEVFTRWFEQTALSTVMQIGTSSNNVAWEFSAQTGFDQEMLDWYRSYTRLHLRLFPYEWSYAQKLLVDGRPIQRALGLAFPELSQHPNDIYLFGDSLLVAPVVEEGKTAREVLFPEGTWVNYWTGARVEGSASGHSEMVDAPLGVLPLFLRAGGLVPMLRPTIDTLGPVDDPLAIDSYATTPGILYVRAAAGPESVFEVFDGSVLGQSLNDKELKLRYQPGQEFKEGAIFELIGLGQKPLSVQIGGITLSEAMDLNALVASEQGFWFEGGTGGTLWLKIKAQGGEGVVQLP